MMKKKKKKKFQQCKNKCVNEQSKKTASMSQQLPPCTALSQALTAGNQPTHSRRSSALGYSITERITPLRTGQALRAHDPAAWQKPCYITKETCTAGPEMTECYRRSSRCYKVLQEVVAHLVTCQVRELKLKQGSRHLGTSRGPYLTSRGSLPHGP